MWKQIMVGQFKELFQLHHSMALVSSTSTQFSQKFLNFHLGSTRLWLTQVLIEEILKKFLQVAQ